jgi:P4 family phage/plasmid primase-like protien
VVQLYPTGHRGYAKAVCGRLDELLPIIQSANRDGCSVSIMTNPATGPKQIDVQEIRVVFADDDTYRMDPRTDWPLAPHMVVESSDGRYHYYWLIESGCITPEELGKLQKMIAARFGTDGSLSDFAKKARLPGTYHLKGMPFRTRIEKISAHPHYTREELEDAFGNFTVKVQTSKKKRTPASCNTALIQDDKIMEGTRDETLFRIASSMRGRNVGYNEAIEELRQINAERVDPPMDDATVVAKVDSAYSRYEPNPTYFPLTDTGNAERFVAMFGNEVCYSFTTKSWWIWNGKIWREDTKGIVDRLAVQAIRSIIADAATVDNMQVRDAMLGWAKKSEARRAIRAMLEGAQSLVAIDQDRFDGDAYLLNVQNGIVDLKMGTLLPHDPAKFCTKLAGCDFVPGALASNFMKFVNDFCCGDAELIDFLQREVGACLLGAQLDRSFLMFYGRGRNGKSVLGRVIQNLVGDYAVVLNPEFMLTAAKDDKLEALALRGARVALCQELPENGKLAESRIKLMTGGDILKARGLYQNYQQFRVTANLLLFGNHKPFVSGADAVWDRLKLFPCEFRPTTEDPHFADKLMKELPGILNWALEGLSKYLTEGQILPARIVEELKDYRAVEDSLGAFIDENFELHSANRIEVSEVYKMYETYARENGEFVMSQKALTKKLSERGIGRSRTSLARFYVGLGYKTRFPFVA